MSALSHPLKILVLTTSFPLEKASRSGIFVKRLVDNFPETLQATVLTPDGPFDSISDSENYSLIRFRYAPKKWQQLAHGSGGLVAALSRKKLSCLLIPVFLLSSLLSCCRYALQADILHANWSINGVIAGVSGLIVRKPVVTTLRGSDVNLIHSSWLMRQFVYLSLYLSERVIVVSASLRDCVVREFPDHCHKIQVIVNGLDDMFFAQNFHATISSKTVRFLYVGNLIKGKGVKFLLEAVGSLKTQDWSLDIVGDGSEKQNLIAYCEHNRIDAKVIFHGAVSPEKIPRFLQKADVFVFASLAEGRPNVVLEAMAMGLPVIASAIPAVQELITDGDQGLLFPPGNIEKLRELMERMITQVDERHYLGKMAREYILAQKMSWSEAGRQYAAVFSDIYMNSSGAV